MNATKLAALFVLALFVTSLVPFVAADEGSNEEIETEIVPMELTGTGENKERMGHEAFEKAREELKMRAEMHREELRAKRSEARMKIEHERMALKELHEKMRMEYKADRERLRKLHEELREDRKALKEKREHEREALGEVRERIQKCAGSDSPECVEARAQARGHAKAYLEHTAKSILEMLGRARERVADNPELVAEIDNAIAEVGAAIETVNALGDTATKEDLKEASQIIRETGHQALKAIKKGVGKKASDRIGGVISKMTQLQKKFDRKIEQLKKQGKDTASAEAKKAEFQARLDAAAKLHAEAKVLFEAGDHPAAAEKIRASHVELKAAHQILMGLVHEIRGIGGDLDDETEPADEDAAPAAPAPAPVAAEPAPMAPESAPASVMPETMASGESTGGTGSETATGAATTSTSTETSDGATA